MIAACRSLLRDHRIISTQHGTYTWCKSLCLGLMFLGFAAFSPTLLFCADTLNVIIIVAHPDEAEEYAGGTAALLSAAGHRVKFLSVTNGDVGHWNMTKEALAVRRRDEAFAAGKILGASYEIFPYHDGELENSVELRKRVVRAIRGWKADIVFSIKPAFGGGHPDEMASGIAVQQGAGLSSAPLFMPEIPALKKRPLFLWILDYYSKAFPHTPDLVIPIDSTIEKKLLSFNAHASQFYEFAPWQKGILDQVPATWPERRLFLLKHYEADVAISDASRGWLVKWFGEEKGRKFRYAEEFEFPHYSRKTDNEELKKMFSILLTHTGTKK
ncbi:MAG: PIG-L family deacetylase [Ignavibacteriales bacterium]|nr:PIG-L family deacetylase [Ignavibacteriales bacterium]